MLIIKIYEWQREYEVANYWGHLTQINLLTAIVGGGGLTTAYGRTIFGVS